MLDSNTFLLSEYDRQLPVFRELRTVVENILDLLLDGLDILYGFRIFLIHLNIKDINTSIYLEQESLSFHHRF